MKTFDFIDSVRRHISHKGTGSYRMLFRDNRGLFYEPADTIVTTQTKYSKYDGATIVGVEALDDDPDLNGQAPPCNNGGGQSMGVWEYCDLPKGHKPAHIHWGWTAVQSPGMNTATENSAAIAERTFWEDEIEDEQ